jgi:TRAP-type mannitol/chloroaromatic compound transport system substrate-binding protein
MLATTGGAIAAPAVARAQETFNWHLITSWPPEFPGFQSGPGSAEDFAVRVKAMSGGRLNIKVHPAGTLAPWNEVFDACSAGTAQMGHSTSYYWMGKTVAAAFFCAVPFGLNFEGHNAWIYEGGGQELWDEVYGDFNLVAFPCGNTGVQMTGWFRKPIETIEDLKGLKMRVSGLAGSVYKEVGVTQQTMPAGEIFPSLERGVIDAAEWVGPYQDARMGFHKVAKYYHSTGWHEPSTTSEIMINKQAWESLPDDLKAVVRNAADACNLRNYMWYQAVNSEALDDMVRNHGVIASPLPDSVVELLKSTSREVLAAKVEGDPVAKKVHDHYFAFKEKWSKWADITDKVYHNQIR